MGHEIVRLESARAEKEAEAASGMAEPRPWEL
ncbi:hypothetical protein ABIC30_004518 [Methylobacterium sp. 1030]|jgi:hypothetical protein